MCRANEFVVDIVADKTTTLDLKVAPSDVNVPDVSHRPNLAVTAKFDKDTDVPKPATIVVVVEAGTKKVVARTITDAEGNFGVAQLPVGRYDLIVPGPWKVEIRRMNPWFLVRAGGESWVQLFHLVPGPEVEDPGYQLPENQTPGGDVPPVAGGGSGDALAKTGASVLGLGVLGVLFVAFGFGASLIGRRRQTA